MRTLLYNCPAGISGDMNLAALVALGADSKKLETELRKLPYTDWSLSFEPDSRKGINGLRCLVQIDADIHSHSHEEEDTHAHTHRSFWEIKEAIEASSLKASVKADALNCFQVLAEAEGAVHGVPPEAVHFHEVGALDSIIDIVGAAICWDLLQVDQVVCATLEVGGGTVKCAHGIMPVPAPATARLLNGIPFSSGASDNETTTPTGAALLVGKSCLFKKSLQGTQLKTAIAIGQRDDTKLPNALYVSLIQTDDLASSDLEQDQVLEMATNIDDMSAEAVSYLCEQLIQAGALDVWQTPATFKKGRLGCVVHALSVEKEQHVIEAAFFKHSRSLGIRRQLWQRSKLKRIIERLETKWGTVGIKTAKLPDGSSRFKFEYEDCARIASAENQSLAWVEEQLNQQLIQ